MLNGNVGLIKFMLRLEAALKWMYRQAIFLIQHFNCDIQIYTKLVDIRLSCNANLNTILVTNDGIHNPSFQV